MCSCCGVILTLRKSIRIASGFPVPKIICNNVCMWNAALKHLVKYDNENYFLACKTFENEELLGHIDSGDT